MFASRLIQDNNFHYVMYAVLFWMVPPVTLALAPLAIYGLFNVIEFNKVKPR